MTLEEADKLMLTMTRGKEVFLWINPITNYSEEYIPGQMLPANTNIELFTFVRD